MRLVLFSFTLLITGVCTACSDTDTTPLDMEQENTTVNADSILIVYYSRSGNTRSVANQVHQLIGGDLLEIETVDAYPADYNSILQQAQNELDSGYLPPLKTVVDDMDKYAVIFIGHPIWHGRTPPPMQSFLSSYNLSGKRIVQFCTHGGSGIAQSRSDLSRLCPNSTLSESLAIRGSSANDPGTATTITNWLNQIGINLLTHNTRIRITVGSEEFIATMDNNETATAFMSMLPMTINMAEMGGYEKYHYLPQNLSGSATNPGTTYEGDLMIWSSNCLVLFYATRSTSYSYIRIGRIGDTSGLAAALGSGSVTVTFELENSTTAISGLQIKNESVISFDQASINVVGQCDRITLIDSGGNIIKQNKGNRMGVVAVPSGCYIIKADAGKNRFVRKIIKK